MRILKYDIEKVTGIPWKKKKSYRYLYRLACREDVIKKAFKRMRKGKTKRKEWQRKIWIPGLRKSRKLS